MDLRRLYSRRSGAWLGATFADWQALLQDTFPVITDTSWVATTKPLAWQSGVSDPAAGWVVGYWTWSGWRWSGLAAHTFSKGTPAAR